jgi:UDP-N-acetylglucosamine:LPS N-acetylglucosamine transferase
LVAAGAALALGEVSDLPITLPQALRQLAEPGRLPAMTHAASAITDGQGAARVADALRALSI